jgi:hypothetical protein
MTLALQSEFDLETARDARGPEAMEVAAEERTWLSRALAERVDRDPRCACRGGPAGVCERRFRGGCAFAMRAGELDQALSRLSTHQLQALLRLEQFSRPAPTLADDPPAGRPIVRTAQGC